MRALLQRVRYGSVSIEEELIGEIGPGLVILLGVRHQDTRADAEYLARKCVNLRIFSDEHGNLNRSLLEVGGEALIISQFTLYSDTRKGRRPSFIEAGRPEISRPLYDYFVEQVKSLGVPVKTGRFGAMMLVKIHNDGPVTLMVESKA